MNLADGSPVEWLSIKSTEKTVANVRRELLEEVPQKSTQGNFGKKCFSLLNLSLLKQY